MFVVFFSIGATALGGSILFTDLLQYYNNKELLKEKGELSTQLKSLNADYDVLLQQLKNDPNLLKRIADVTLVKKDNDANTIYPKATAQQLKAAKTALTGQTGDDTPDSTLPKWLTRCKEPRRRTTLFFAGVGLILVSFICFAPARDTNQEKARN